MKEITKSITTQSQAIIPLAFLSTDKIWQPNTSTNQRFIESGEHLVQHLVAAIDAAKECICFTSFIFQNGDIIKALERASERGVNIFVLTSTLHFDNKPIYEEEENYKTIDFKKMLNTQMRSKVLLRCANNIHAKFMLIDPNSTHAEGFLATCNFTEKATKENPELVAVLTQQETLELFKIFVWHFWEATTDEQTTEDRFNKIKPKNRFELPVFKSLLLTSTKAKQTTIRDYTKQLIQQAKSTITFSTFGFKVSHELGKLLLQKCKAGLKVTIFARNRSKAINGNLDKLALAGATIYTHNLLHAKFIAVDNQLGAIFTANFEEHGMDEGFEVGLKLNKEDVQALQNIIDRWKNSFSHYTKANTYITKLPEKYFVMGDRNLQEKTIKTTATKQERVSPHNLNDLIKVWAKKDIFNQNTIKNYCFQLTFKLKEFELDKLLSEQELTPNIYLGEYEEEVKITPAKSSKKNKSKDKIEKEESPKKIKKQIIFLTEEVDLNRLSEFQKYGNLPVFALKI